MVAREVVAAALARPMKKCKSLHVPYLLFRSVGHRSHPYGVAGDVFAAPGLPSCLSLGLSGQQITLNTLLSGDPHSLPHMAMTSGHG